MKKVFGTIGLALIGATSFAQTPCEMGFADIYPCEGMDMISHLEIDDLGGGENMNDIWGWTSADGREIVIAGRSNGTSFVDITDPVNPIYLGDLPTQTNPSLWRDMKVYNDYAFIVSEAGLHGMQIFDLNQLLDVENPPVIFESDAFYDNFGNSHNIVINEESGYAYSVGTTTFSGGLHIVDISDPLNPTIAGGYDGSGYVHDAQVVNYAGPDLDYAGKEIAFCSAGSTFSVVDVSQKDDCEEISSKVYENLSYVHQGWLTEDHRYFVMNDEVDESNYQFNTRTHLFDCEDLDDPIYLGYYEHPVLSSDHNLYVKGNYAYMSNYLSGLRVVDLTNLPGNDLTEVAYFDVEPAVDQTGYWGSWSNYPYFESGNIAVTSMGGGLFILKLQEGIITSVEETIEQAEPVLSVGPNPASGSVRINWEAMNGAQLLRLVDAMGRTVKSIPVFNVNGNIELQLDGVASGVYFLQSDLAGQESVKLVVE